MRILKLVMVLFAIITIASCNNKQSEKTGEHGHTDNLQLTAYSESFEVYAEATPFSKGEESEILAHFSFLKNFKPIIDGKVTIRLISGSNEVRQTLDKPTRKGIFLFKLTPKSEGEAKIVFDIETSGLNSQIIIPNIKVFKDTHDAQHHASSAVATSSNGAIFTKEQSWKLDFATEEIRVEPFGQVIRATAQILPSQGDQRVIAAKASGIVSFSGQEIVEGKKVGAGQSLFAIESEGMADNNLTVRFSEATAEYNRAKSDYDRKKELAEEKIVSQNELNKSQTEFVRAEAVYKNLRKNFSSGKQFVSSPIGGFVTQVLVQNGEYVEAGRPIIVVSQNKDLLIKAELQPKYYQYLSNIRTANFVNAIENVRYTLEELGGRIVSFGKSADINNPLIPVIFQVKNSVGLLPGGFIEVYIKTITSNTAVTIPNEAIIEEMGNYFVYCQITPEFFEKRLIKKGTTDGYRTEVLEGVNIGERVVSKGAILVKLAQASGALDAHSGHVH